MKVTLLSILFLLVSLFAIGLILYRIKFERIGIRSATIWVVLWAGIGFFSIYPDLLNTAVQLVQMKNRMLFLLTISVFVLFSFVFNLSSRLDKTQRDLSKIIQELSIINYQIEKKTHLHDK